MGGALARRSPGAGARATLPGSLAMLSLGVAEDEASAATARTYLESVERAVLPYRTGDYPNFVMEPADASSFFDADTWARACARSRRCTTRATCSKATTNPPAS